MGGGETWHERSANWELLPDDPVTTTLTDKSDYSFSLTPEIRSRFG
jgi:hypothetical protein